MKVEFWREREKKLLPIFRNCGLCGGIFLAILRSTKPGPVEAASILGLRRNDLNKPTMSCAMKNGWGSRYAHAGRAIDGVQILI